MVLTDKQKQELEDALDELSLAKKALNDAKGKPGEAEARQNLLGTLDKVNKVNKVCESFKAPAEWRSDFEVHANGNDFEVRAIKC